MGEAAWSRRDRYRERPLFVILENYILAAIGELPGETHDRVGQVVRRAFGGGDDWMLTVRETLGLADALDEGLRQMWVNNQAIAQRDGTILYPVQFARMVVDENFTALIEPRPS